MAAMVAEVTWGFSDFAQFFGRASGLVGSAGEAYQSRWKDFA
jgi:hypothetical protein